MTDPEMAVMNAFTDAWNLFVQLPRCHPSEVEEGIRAIHELQSLVMVRAAVRAHPDVFRHVKEFA